MRMNVLILILLILVLRAAGHAQPTAPHGAMPVTIDFRAAAADGQPVLDLKAADVALKIDGRARTIQSLEIVRVAGSEGAAAQAPLSPPFATNAAAGGGRQLTLVIDDESFVPGK